MRTLLQLPMRSLSRDHVKWLSPLPQMLCIKTWPASDPIWTQSMEHIFTDSNDVIFTLSHDNNICTSINVLDNEPGRFIVHLETSYELKHNLTDSSGNNMLQGSVYSSEGKIFILNFLCINIEILSNYYITKQKDWKKVLNKHRDWRCSK